jgi:two-component system phosphate regulon sensor histidine kinase PhoR
LADASASSVLGSVAPDGAEEVVAGLCYVVPRPLPEPDLLARPFAAVAAVATLGLVFLGSGWLGLRALRREADAVRARAEFLTVVTHELKTPLAAIRLLAEMLVEDRVPAGRQSEYYGLLAGEAARLTMLIENVLDLGRMERGERAYDLRPCDLLQVVGEAAALFTPLCQRDGLRLQIETPSLPAPALADRDALLQALLNVLDNARKYGAAGRRIDLRAAPEGGALLVQVRDHGEGVPAAERERIFDRFERGSAHRHGAIPGVGLGLHLARAIARRHGGELRCETPPDGGAGALFTFVLPLQPGAEALP